MYNDHIQIEKPKIVVQNLIMGTMYFDSEGTINGSNMELDGDWSNESFVIGYLFDMQIQLPTIYYTYQSGENWRSDTRQLILHVRCLSCVLYICY